MTIKLVNASMTRQEDTSLAIERLLQEVAALCAVNQFSEQDALATFSSAFKNAQSAYGSQGSNSPEIFSAAQVLSEWHQNPLYLTRDGMPKSLSLNAGEFDSLCKTTRTTSDATHILELLIHAGAVKKSCDHVFALRREIIIGDSHPAAAARAVKVAASYLSTLKHNLTRNVRDAPHFERTVVMPFFGERHIPSLLAYLSVHAQSLLEDLDSWMETRSADTDGTEVGVGIFYFKSER